MKKNVLVLYDFMPPFITGAYNRGLFLYNFFQKESKNFLVVSSNHTDIPKRENEEFLENVVYLEKNFSKRKIKKIMYFGSIKGLIDNYWVSNAVNYINSNLQFEPDLIYCSFPSFNTIFLASILQDMYFKNSEFILELRDPIKNYLYLSMKHPFSSLKTLFNHFSSGFVEKKYVGKFHKIITVSNYEADRIKTTYRVPNVYVLESGYFPRKVKPKSAILTNNNKINIGYFGSFSVSDPSRDIKKLKYFFDFIEKSEYKNRFTFNFFGNLKQKEIQFLKKYSFCKYEGVIKKDIESYIESQDILLVFNNNKYKGILTGKVFEYMSFNKPILLFSTYEVELNKFVEKIGGIVLNPLNITFEKLHEIEMLKEKQVLYDYMYSWDYKWNKLKEIISL